MVTRVAFLLTEEMVERLEVKAGSVFQVQSLSKLCTQNGREPVFLTPTCRSEEDLRAVLECDAEQAVIELQKTGSEPYGLDLAHRLADLGIDVALLVDSVDLFSLRYNLEQLTAGLQICGVVDRNLLIRRIDQFLRTGNRFLGQNPYSELVKRQNEAHQTAIDALEACQQLFEHRRRLATRRRG